MQDWSRVSKMRTQGLRPKALITNNRKWTAFISKFKVKVTRTIKIVTETTPETMMERATMTRTTKAWCMQKHLSTTCRKRVDTVWHSGLQFSFKNWRTNACHLIRVCRSWCRRHSIWTTWWNIKKLLWWRTNTIRIQWKSSRKKMSCLLSVRYLTSYSSWGS